MIRIFHIVFEFLSWFLLFCSNGNEIIFENKTDNRTTMNSNRSHFDDNYYPTESFGLSFLWKSTIRFFRMFVCLCVCVLCGRSRLCIINKESERKLIVPHYTIIGYIIVCILCCYMLCRVYCTAWRERVGE